MNRDEDDEAFLVVPLMLFQWCSTSVPSVTTDAEWLFNHLQPGEPKGIDSSVTTGKNDLMNEMVCDHLLYEMACDRV